MKMVVVYNNNNPHHQPVTPDNSLLQNQKELQPQLTYQNYDHQKGFR